MNILICGNYGASNIGDELILKGLLESLSKKVSLSKGRFRGVVVLSYNPKETSKIHNVNSVFFLPCGLRSSFKSFFKLEIFKTLKAYFNCDEFIFGGGGLMQDDNPRAIFIWSIHILTALILGKKLRILGNSVGPLHKRWSRKVVKFLFNRASEITVRDPISKKLLEDIGVKKEVKLVDDFALKLAVSAERSARMSGSDGLAVREKKYLILSLRNWLKGSEKEKFDNEIIKLCNFLIQEKGYEIIAIPFENLRDHDEQYLFAIKDKIKNKNLFHVQKYSSDVNKIFELYSQANLVIGMRLHCIILAHKFKKPFIALSYSEKVRGFCESIGKEKNCFDIKNISFAPIYNILNTKY